MNKYQEKNNIFDRFPSKEGVANALVKINSTEKIAKKYIPLKERSDLYSSFKLLNKDGSIISYKTKEEAIQARIRGEEKFFGEFKRPEEFK